MKALKAFKTIDCFMPVKANHGLPVVLDCVLLNKGVLV